MRAALLMLAPLTAILVAVPVSTASASTVSGKTATQSVSTISSARGAGSAIPERVAAPSLPACFPDCNEFMDGAQCINTDSGIIYTCTYVEGVWVWVPDIAVSITDPRSPVARLSH
jgi:hypothetical protein